MKENIKAHTYCVILAGGVGRRLWPSSRAEKPKQFVDFFGTGRTLLQQTFDRFAAILPTENILISTFDRYLPLVREQLPEITPAQIFSEPVQLSSGPAAAWVSSWVNRHDPDSLLIVAPCDQLVLNGQRFEEELSAALEHVANFDDLLVMGARPTQPNTTYGYIQKDTACCDREDIFTVKSFSEKPDRQFAKMFVDSGEFVWNTGIVLWRTATFAAQLKDLMPVVAAHEAAFDEAKTEEEERALIQRYYPAATFVAIDLLLLEKGRNVRVQETNFGWADVGSWPELHNAHAHDADGNAIIGDTKVLLTGCRENTIHLPEGMAAVVKDLDGYLVALRGNVLVVCPNRDPSLVRKLLTEAQVQFGEEYA